MTTTQYIASLALDEASITPRTPEIEHERQVAMNDMIEWNHFAINGVQGPYAITLGTAENRVTMAATSETLATPLLLTVPLAPFRGLVRDYFLICESYFAAVRSGNLPRIEAIDMSRRGLHNEGSELLPRFWKIK